MHRNSSSRRAKVATHYPPSASSRDGHLLHLRANGKLPSIHMDANFKGFLGIGLTFKLARKSNPEGSVQRDVTSYIGPQRVL